MCVAVGNCGDDRDGPERLSDSPVLSQVSAPPVQPTLAAGRHRVNILGLRIDAVDLSGACVVIESWITERRREYVCVTGAHGVIEARSDRHLHAIHAEAGLVVPDGMPLVFMARRLGFPETSRVYGPELMRRLTAHSAEKGWSQFYYGGTPGLAQRLATELHVRHPDLLVAGLLSPPFRPLSRAEDEHEVETINSCKPDIVWVGLSTPKQELWMSEHRAKLDAPVLIGVGAAFDFLAGTKPQAPLWMQRSGLEWLYRLGSEPRRLWRRYARIVPAFAALALLQFISMRFGRRRTSSDARIRREP